MLGATHYTRVSEIPSDATWKVIVAELRLELGGPDVVGSMSETESI